MNIFGLPSVSCTSFHIKLSGEYSILYPVTHPFVPPCVLTPVRLRGSRKSNCKTRNVNKQIVWRFSFNQFTKKIKFLLNINIRHTWIHNLTYTIEPKFDKTVYKFHSWFDNKTYNFNSTASNLNILIRQFDLKFWFKNFYSTNNLESFNYLKFGFEKFIMRFELKMDLKFWFENII